MRRKIALLFMVAATLGVMAISILPNATADPEANNWYVCKYVGPPASPNETLAGGQNPILVDQNAILAQTGLATVTVGDEFADGQDQSVVIAGPVAPPGSDPEPSCPVPTTTPPPPPCPNGTTTITVTKTITVSAVATVEETCTVTETVTTTVPTTVPPPPPPQPPQPPPACPGSVKLGPWYGDPQINITLTGKGTFVVKGGVQRFSDIHVFNETLDCNEMFKIGRYKVERGHFLNIFQDGVRVVHQKPPRFN